MDSDLIVVDEFYKEAGSYFKKKGEHLESVGREYLRSLRLIKSKGICSGETAEALDAYIELAEKLNECASFIGSSMSTMMDNYITVIDNKDRYLY